MGKIHTQNDTFDKLFYYLHLNEKCNLSCNYCYYKELPSFMNKNIEYDVFDLLKSIIKSPIQHHVVTFYGKEPLLSLDFIRDCFKEVSNQKKELSSKQIDFGLITNGMLLHHLSEEDCNKFKLIVVSFNGLTHYHNTGRGEGTFDVVLNNIRKIKPIYKGILEGRLVIAEGVNVNLAVTSMLNFFDTIHWSLLEHINSESYNNFIDQYCLQIKDLYGLWLKELSHGKVHNIIPFVGAIKNRINDEKYTRLQCGAGFNSVGVGLDGTFYKCIDCVGMRAISEEYKSGSIQEGFHPGNGIPMRDECKSCDYLHWCGGRCMWTLDQSYCRANRYLLGLVGENIEKVRSLLAKGIFSLNDFNDFVIEYEEVTV